MVTGLVLVDICVGVGITVDVVVVLLVVSGGDGVVVVLVVVVLVVVVVVVVLVLGLKLLANIVTVDGLGLPGRGRVINPGQLCAEGDQVASTKLLPAPASTSNCDMFM